jgi:phosphatidylserine/phosphatidylglycerophosphate/cardiolipin synthase-like enzyme
MAAPHFQFYSKPEYYADLITRLGRLRAGDRFFTANMVTLPWHPEVTELLNAMCAAARRGAEVALITDSHNFLLDDDRRLVPGPMLFHRELPMHGLVGRFQEQLDAFEQLKAAGGRYVLLNRPKYLFSNPQAGRNHIKFTLINDRYYLGGCNLEAYYNLDLMVGATDARVAGWVAAIGQRMLKTGHSRTAIGQDDVTYEGAPGTTFMLDSGVPHRSVILRKALDLIDSSQEHIFLTCQFFPGGITARRLKAAHRRGVKVTIVFNSPSVTRSVARLGFEGAQLIERLQCPADFFRFQNHGPSYLHTKVLATDQGTMVGSHNFVPHGVALGTAEIAMLVRDEEFGREAVTTVTRQLPSIIFG